MVYLIFKSGAAFFVSFAAGILIDIDHILDYYMQQRVTLRIKEIYRWCEEWKSKFVFIYFHSLELIFILWVVIVYFKMGIFWIAFAIGITQHIFLDILFNRAIYAYSYFLSFRIIKGFRSEELKRKFKYAYLEK